MSEEYPWQRAYRIALLETDSSRLAQLIKEAQAALHARLDELRSKHNETAAEREAIESALLDLSVLRNEVRSTNRAGTQGTNCPTRGTDLS